MSWATISTAVPAGVQDAFHGLVVQHAVQRRRSTTGSNPPGGEIVFGDVNVGLLACAEHVGQHASHGS